MNFEPGGHKLPPNSARAFGRMSWNRSKRGAPVPFFESMFGGGALAGALHSATTKGSTAVRRSRSLNKELNVDTVGAVATGGAAIGEAADGGAAATA